MILPAIEVPLMDVNGRADGEIYISLLKQDKYTLTLRQG